MAALVAPTINAGSCNWTGSITCQGNLTPQGTYAGSTPVGLPSVPLNYPLSNAESLTFSATPGSGQYNLIVDQYRTLAASGSETLDLYGSTTPLLDIGGGTCAFRHIKLCLIWIWNGGDISGLTVGNAGSDPWLGNLSGTTTTQTCYPTGAPLCWAGEPVTGLVVSTTHGQLLITNNSSAVSVTYALLIAGTTT
jgi:hypothetical protein